MGHAHWCFCTADFSSTHSGIIEAERKPRGLALRLSSGSNAPRWSAFFSPYFREFLYLCYVSFSRFSAVLSRRSRESYSYSIIPEKKSNYVQNHQIMRTFISLEFLTANKTSLKSTANWRDIIPKGIMNLRCLFDIYAKHQICVFF